MCIRDRGLGLGLAALNGNQPVKGQAPLTTQANLLATQGNNLINSSLNNALPPAAQAQLNLAADSMKAQIKSQYSQMGLAGSTMESQALSGVDQRVASQGYTIMQNLLAQGMSMEQAANTALTQVMQTNAQQSNALGSAVGNFAGALAGSAL